MIEKKYTVVGIIFQERKKDRLENGLIFDFRFSPFRGMVLKRTFVVVVVQVSVFDEAVVKCY